MRQVIWGQGTRDPRGIYSVCTADPLVLRAALKQAVEDGSPALIEATSNQVNQFGGYTGMEPPAFVEFVLGLAREMGLPPERLILGGDHLGPNPWQRLAAEEAMRHACDLVEAFVACGFTKIHLDASMPLGEERAGGALSKRVVAERTAQLCEAAEAAFRKRSQAEGASAPPLYVIGSDVPPPGGETSGSQGPKVTTPEEFEETVALTRATFHDRGLDDAWGRVIAVVVQPGVDFGEWQVHPYDRAAAASLTRALTQHPGLAFEGHSTDYQTPGRLRQMAEDGIAILKVGPALTFAKREALFALNALESEVLGTDGRARRSNVEAALEEAMLADPRHWSAYYSGDEHELRLKRKYGLSDRCRYYWPVPSVQEAVQRLLGNLREAGIPLPLLSQFLPRQYERVREGVLRNDPEELVLDRIRDVLRGYAAAVGTGARRAEPSPA
ncbi:class II D-tagatose-bisphosphate aldolase non-catalytic subunit [Limnochorda pilosa]|uniref:class II D-tagatose-bisphosphate aldolase non-catalytic subunit n=1 Tax=Limnochorda pilosa TaxID=1555112 RepID=UPI00082D2183